MSTKAKETLLEKAQRMTAFDRQFGECVCGVDEAGRGPLVGPVTVCACIMPNEPLLLGIDDSKKLGEAKREELFEKIVAVADYCVVSISRDVIDSINILQATKLGMKKAIEGLRTTPAHAVIDAVKGLDISVPFTPVVKADAQSYCVAAASIIAKVTRDRLMRELDRLYPMYGFASNKGYGTAAHIAALKEYGACPEHRRTFIKNFTADSDLPLFGG